MADLLDSVGSALGLTKNGEVAKLLVESYSDKDRNRDKKTFDSFINPDEYSLNYNVVVDNANTPGKGTNDQGKFLQIQPLEVTLKFFLDGTNIVPDRATGKQLNVPDKISQFHDAVGYDGTVHRPRYLRLIWGKAAWLRANQLSFDCYLKSASFQYKLFDKEGTPLRVIITATFTEVLSAPAAQATDGNGSPDLTHVRIVKEGDTLPAMAFDIYGDIKYYMEVARVNGLTNFRNLLPGQTIVFPPFDKNTRKK